MRRAAASALACALLAWPSASRAVRPITPPAPEFPENAAWLNSQPFTMKGLAGRRVVLVEFLNTSNVNSIRSLKVLNRWWDQYALKGLMIIGVHDSDFDFDRDPVIVRDSLKRVEIRFPVVLDGGRRLWRAYENEGWPAGYLVDSNGLIVHDRLGEGGSAEMELEILGALERLNGFRPPEGYAIPSDPVPANCGRATGPIYLGGRRRKSVPEMQSVRSYTILSSREGEVSQLGRWQGEPDALRFAAASNAELSAQALAVYAGVEAYAVMNRAGPRPARVYLKQDDLWLNADSAGADVAWDKQGRSYVLVDAPRLYYLTHNAKDDAHELRLFPTERGLGIYSFEFSNRCQTRFDHR